MKNSQLETTPILYNKSSVKIIKVNKGPGAQCFRMHWHDRLELLRINEGELFVDFGTRQIIAKPNDLVIIPPHRVHMGYATETRVKYNAIMFDLRTFYNNTEVCKKILPEIFDGVINFVDITRNVDVIKSADYITKKVTDEKTALEIVSCVYLIIMNLYTNCRTVSKPETKSDKSIKQILSYIEERFNKEINIAQISEMFGYSLPYFCRKFKDYTGLTPTNYVNTLKMEKAYNYIVAGDRKVNTIAEKCGFTDPNYFTRRFRKHFKHPPTYYFDVKNQNK